MKIKILIATHKPYKMPTSDLYLPIHCGAKGKKNIGYIGDDTGDSISEKNPYYSELTGLYWAWKNLDYDYLGLSHYRRRFKINDEDKIKSILNKSTIILPRKRKYYIESLYSHYCHTLDSTHLDIAKEIIEEEYPELLSSLIEAYSRTWGYMWNMMIMQKEDVEDYCTFLFSVLRKMEDRIDASKLDDFSKRLYGRVSEILFNAWLINASKKRKLIEIPVYSTEPVNWTKKITGFLEAKFLGKKYKQSF